MLSLTCKVAIKAVIYLASKFDSGEKAGIRDIADHIGASGHTIGKVMQTLVKQGVVNSAKGPMGGFYLSGAQREQPLINIVEAVDGRQTFKGCGLGLSRCSDAHPCPIHYEYKAVRDGMYQLFSEKRVADLCDAVNNNIAHLIG